MKSGIYIITNTENQKHYIGSTINFKGRWSAHRSLLQRNKHSNPHLQRAWNKCGESGFEFGVLEYLGNLEELHIAEQFWMDVYREEGKELYNCGLVARHGMLGTHHTEDGKQKISESLRGNQNHLGHKHTEEAKQRMSETHKGKVFTEEHKHKISLSKSGEQHPLWGKCHSEATKRKISESLKKYHSERLSQGSLS